MIKEKITSLLFFILSKISIILPKSIKIFISKVIATLLYRFHRRYYKVAKINLDFIYKDSLTTEEKEQIIKGMFFNLAQNLGSFIENQNISKEKLLHKVTFKNEEIMTNALKSDRAVIFITAHQSNWEILSIAAAAKFTPISVVGRRIKQPYLNNIIKQSREKFGVDIIDKNGAMRHLVKAIKKKKPIGLLVDQNLEGIYVDFFSKKTMHTTTAAMLAYKFNAMVIPCFVSRVDFEKYEATFYEPIEVEKSDNLEQYILEHTQKQAKITEEVIKKAPQEWLWIHRRWKSYYPDIYKL